MTSRRPIKFSKYSIYFLSSAMLIGIVNMKSWAGFEWIPPNNNAQVMERAAPISKAPPVAPVVSEPVPAAPQQPVIKQKVMQSQPVQAAPTQQRIVMPENAPASAVQATQNAAVRQNAQNMPARTSAPEASAQTAPTPISIQSAPPPSMRQEQPVKTAQVPMKETHAKPSQAKKTLSINARPLNPSMPASMPDVKDSVPPSNAVMENAVGFGKDVPLAMALRQVAPARYAFSFADGINPGLRVDWQGGKPWDVVITEMLAPFSIHARITQNTIHVQKVTPSIQMPVQKTEIYMNPYGYVKEKDTGKQAMAQQNQPSPRDLPPSYKRQAVQNPGQGEPLLPLTLTKQDMQQPPGVEPSSGIEGFEKAEQNDSNIRVWNAPAGSSLRAVLENWARSVGMRLVWHAPFDYVVSSDVSVEDTLGNAANTLIQNGVAFDPKPSINVEGEEGSGTLTVRSNA